MQGENESKRGSIQAVTSSLMYAAQEADDWACVDCDRHKVPRSAKAINLYIIQIGRAHV